MTYEKKKNFIVSALFYALLLLLIYCIFRYLIVWFMPFLIGLLIAVCLQKPANWLHKKTKIPQKFLAAALVFLCLGLLGVIVWQIGFYLVNQVSGLADLIPVVVNELPEIMDNITNRFSHLIMSLPGNLDLSVNTLTQSVLQTVQNIASSFSQSAGSWAINVMKNVPNIIVSFVITIISCCFISVDYDNIVIFIKRQLSPRVKSLLVSIKNTFLRNTLRMLRAYLLIMFVTFVELAVGLSLLRVNYSVILAAIICVVDILPVLGTGTVLIPWAVIAFLLGNTYLAIGIAVLYAIIAVIRNIIEPKIVGKQIGLHPIVTLIAIYVGLKTFGFLGLFFFPMTLIVLKSLHESGEIHLWND